MNTPILITLASTSPRRRELLANLGMPFEVKSVAIDENPRVGEMPHDYIMRMVRAKADTACQDVACGIIITADTIGVIDDEILTKPIDKAHAFIMWDKLSDKTHQIWTAVCATTVKNNQIIYQKSSKLVQM